MRQKLPETAGYPLLVNDIGKTVYPGEEFDCPLPVPGCVPVDDAEGAEDGGEGSGADKDQPAKGRAQQKESRP